ncbi:MAG: hypothetical protein RIF46_15935 [Cyclobacteriaceae bacterium]
MNKIISVYKYLLIVSLIHLVSCREEMECERVVDYVFSNETNFVITLPFEQPVQLPVNGNYVINGESQGRCEDVNVKFESPLTTGIIVFNENEFCWDINPNNDLTQAEGPAKIQNYQFKQIGKGRIEFEYVFQEENLEYTTSCE